MAISKIYIDRRSFVRGAKSHLNLDNWLDLNKHIIGVINASGGTPGSYNFQNGITQLPSSQNVILGGNMIQDTSLDFVISYSFFLKNMNSFITNGVDLSFNYSNTIGLNGTNGISLTSDLSNGQIGLFSSFIGIDSVNEFILQTPQINANTRKLGSMLQVFNVTPNDPQKGFSEFSEYAFPLSPGNNGNILRLNNTDELEWTDINNVLYFNDNPTDTVQNTIGTDTQIDLHTLDGNEFVNNGSYIEYEISLKVTNYNTPFSVKLWYNPATFVNYDIEAEGHVSIKGRIYKVSSSEFLSESFVNLFEPVRNKLVDTEVFHVESTLPGGWNNSTLDLQITFTNSDSSQSIELLHYSINKNLK